MENAIQAGVFLLTAASVLLSQQSNEELKRYACIAGLLVQPLWVHVALTTNQWGVLWLAVLTTMMWSLGFYNYWIKKVDKSYSYVYTVREIRPSEEKEE